MASRAERELRQVKVAEMDVNGFTVDQIADALNVSVETIRGDLIYVAEMRREFLKQDMQDRRDRHVQALDALKRTMWLQMRKAVSTGDIPASARCSEQLRRIEVDQAKIDGTFSEAANIHLTNQFALPTEHIEKAYRMYVELKKRGGGSALSALRAGRLLDLPAPQRSDADAGPTDEDLALAPGLAQRA